MTLTISYGCVGTWYFRGNPDPVLVELIIIGRNQLRRSMSVGVIFGDGRCNSKTCVDVCDKN